MAAPTLNHGIHGQVRSAGMTTQGLPTLDPQLRDSGTVSLCCSVHWAWQSNVETAPGSDQLYEGHTGPSKLSHGRAGHEPGEDATGRLSTQPQQRGSASRPGFGVPLFMPAVQPGAGAQGVSPELCLLGISSCMAPGPVAATGWAAPSSSREMARPAAPSSVRPRPRPQRPTGPGAHAGLQGAAADLAASCIHVREAGRLAGLFGGSFLFSKSCRIS